MPLCAATQGGTSITAAVSILELQIPANTRAEILRMWISPDAVATPIDEVVRIAIYMTGTAATGGLGMTERAIREGDPTPKCVAVRGAAESTPTDIYADAFHTKVGWLWLPQPEERPVLIGGGTYDNIGIRTPVSPPVTISSLAIGVQWNELSA